MISDEAMTAEINKLLTSFSGRDASDTLNVLCNALVTVAKQVGVDRGRFTAIALEIYDKCISIDGLNPGSKELS